MSICIWQQPRYFQVKIRNNDYVQGMFQTREHSRFNKIVIYVLQQQPQHSQIVGSLQVFEETNDNDHTEIDVIDKEEEEVYETLVDSMVNDDSADKNHKSLPASHV